MARAHLLLSSPPQCDLMFVTVWVSAELPSLAIYRMEPLRLEKTLRSPSPTSPCPPAKCLSATSLQFLNTSRNGDSTTAPSSLFYYLTTLLLRKVFQIPSLHLPWHNLRTEGLRFSGTEALSGKVRLACNTARFYLENT